MVLIILTIICHMVLIIVLKICQKVLNICQELQFDK
jgi:hypothetical protein